MSDYRVEYECTRCFKDYGVNLEGFDGPLNESQLARLDAQQQPCQTCLPFDAKVVRVALTSGNFTQGQSVRYCRAMAQAVFEERGRPPTWPELKELFGPDEAHRRMRERESQARRRARDAFFTKDEL